MTADESVVRVERRDGGIAVVTMDNPKTRNALSPNMLQGLADTFEALMADPSARAIVFTGAGETFCAGGDISHMKRERRILDSRASMSRNHRIVRAIVAGPKPVIAAAEGPAAGAGLSLAVCCDYVVAGKGSSFSAAFAKVGLVPDLGLFWSLPQRVGLGMAKRMILLAPVVKAEAALELGIVDELTDQGAAMGRALELAAEFAAVAPLSVAVTKAVYAEGCTTLEDCLRAERDHQPYLFRSEDHLGAVEAFRIKKPFAFHGN